MRALGVLAFVLGAACSDHGLAAGEFCGGGITGEPTSDGCAAGLLCCPHPYPNCLDTPYYCDEPKDGYCSLWPCGLPDMTVHRDLSAFVAGDMTGLSVADGGGVD